MVETKRFVNVGIRNGINGSDRSFESSERTIANNTHTTAWGKYLVAHRMVNAPGPSPMKDCGDDNSTLAQAYLPNAQKATKEQF